MGRRRGPETEDMPQGVILRKRNGKEYYYFQTKSIDWFRREYPIGRSKSEAADRLKDLLKRLGNITPTYKKSRPLTNKWFIPELLKNTKARAVRRGIEFNLTVEFLEELIKKNNYKCALTGIPFDLAKDINYRVRPWCPSIDRIECSKGYVRENVRIVSNAANLARNEFGDNVLFDMAEGIVMTRYGYKSKTALKIKRLRSAPQNKKQESALSEITD